MKSLDCGFDQIRSDAKPPIWSCDRVAGVTMIAAPPPGKSLGTRTEFNGEVFPPTVTSKLGWSYYVRLLFESMTKTPKSAVTKPLAGRFRTRRYGALFSSDHSTKPTEKSGAATRGNSSARPDHAAGIVLAASQTSETTFGRSTTNAR